MKQITQIFDQENKFAHFDTVVEFSANDAGIPGAKAEFKEKPRPSLMLDREEIEVAGQ